MRGINAKLEYHSEAPCAENPHARFLEGPGGIVTPRFYSMTTLTLHSLIAGIVPGPVLNFAFSEQELPLLYQENQSQALLAVVDVVMEPESGAALSLKNAYFVSPDAGKHF